MIDILFQKINFEFLKEKICKTILLHYQTIAPHILIA